MPSRPCSGRWPTTSTPQYDPCARTQGSPVCQRHGATRMTDELGLTRDNYPLSRPNPVNALASFAINCTTELPDQVREYVQASLSENTRRAYLSDLAHFQ